MAFEEKDGSGVLWKQEEGGQRPQWTGTVTIDGKQWRLAGWDKTSESDKERISLKVTEVTR